MGLREKKKMQVRMSILKTAERSFRQKGYEKTLIRNLCNEIDISEKTFFNYFPSKQALLSELSIEWYRRRGREVIPRVNDIVESGHVIKEFLKGIRTSAQDIARDKDYMALLLSYADIMHRNRTEALGIGQSLDLRNAQSTHYVQLKRIFEAARMNGEIRDDIEPEEVLEYYTALVSTTVSRWLNDFWDPPGELEDRVIRALESIFYGLAPLQERESCGES